MKFKKIPDDYFYTILDRLTRFTPAYIRYERVFDDVISKFLLSNAAKNKTSLDVISKIYIVEDIINFSLDSSDIGNKAIENLILIEDKYFKQNKLSLDYLSAKINYKKMYDKLDPLKKQNLNMKYLNAVLNCGNMNEISEKRKLEGFLFPVEKIILCEGQTEFILLKTIFKILNINFDKSGILTIQAGGKNQVAKKYYKMIEYCKLPFFILLDKDGVEIQDIILKKIRAQDKLYIIKKGEFEDLIPVDILLNTINSIHKNDIPCSINDFKNDNLTAKNLDEIYRKYGFGEFKKAHFAKKLKNYIEDNPLKINFNDSEITEILKSLQDMQNIL